MGAKTLEYFMSLNYTYQVAWDEDSEAYGAMVLELPGCVAAGDTPAEALEALEEAKQAYIEVALAEGWEIPEPGDPSSYSGKVLLRMANTLHMQLSQWAKQEEISLNQLLVTILGEAVGTRMLQPAQSGTSFPSEHYLAALEDEIMQARRDLENDGNCEIALSPLRKYVLKNQESTNFSRTILSLVDLISHTYHLAEIRTQQKEQAALAKRTKEIAARLTNEIIREGFESDSSELDQFDPDYFTQSEAERSLRTIRVENWPVKGKE